MAGSNYGKRPKGIPPVSVLNTLPKSGACVQVCGVCVLITTIVVI